MTPRTFVTFRHLSSFFQITIFTFSHAPCGKLHNIKGTQVPNTQTYPYFEFVSKQLLSDKDFDSVLPRNILERYFDYVEKSDEYSCHEIIQIFKRIQMIYIVLQDVIQDCPIYEVFQTKFIGRKLAEEIQLQIDKGQLISNFLLVSSKIDPNPKIFVRISALA